MKLLRQLVLALVALQATFAVIVLAGGVVPSSHIVSALRSSNRVGGFGGANYIVGPTGSRVDRFTECVALDVGLPPTRHMNFVQRAFFDSGPLNCQQVQNFLISGELAPKAKKGYFRFWNGVNAISRPLLVTGGVSGTRLLVAIALWGSLVTATVVLARATSALISVLMLGPFVLMTEFPDLIQTIPHAVSATAMLFGVAVLVRRTQRISRGARSFGDYTDLLLVALIVGAVYNFVDYLINPPGAWALSVGAVAVVMAARGAPWRPIARALTATAGGWFVGFGGTWVGKWTIAAVCIGPSRVYSNITDQLAYRSRGADSGHTISTFEPLRTTFNYWTTRPFVSAWLLIAITIVILSKLAVEATRFGGRGLARRAVIISPALLVPVWFMAIHEHTGFHTFLTYRSLAMALGVVLAGCFVKSRTARTVQASA